VASCTPMRLASLSIDSAAATTPSAPSWIQSCFLNWSRLCLISLSAAPNIDFVEATLKKDAAAKVYKKLLKIHKENKTANMKLIDYYKSESPKKAVEYYENLIALEPQQENYYLELAALYNSFGKKDRAFKIYQTLLAVNPNSERAKSEILNSVLAGIKN